MRIVTGLTLTAFLAVLPLSVAEAGGVSTPLTLAGPAPSSNDYAVGDGVPDSGVGTLGGGELVWWNSFTVVSNREIITAVSVLWATVPGGGTFGESGQPYTVHVWSDPNNDGLLDDAVELASAAGVTPDASASLVVEKIAIGPTNVGEAGDGFFVGVSFCHASGEFPAVGDFTVFAGQSGDAGSGSCGTCDSADPVATCGFHEPNTCCDANWSVTANAMASRGSCCNHDGDCADGVLEADCPDSDIWSRGLTCEEAPCIAVPTVSEWGLIVMTLLGCTVGTILYSRRRTARAA